MTEEKSDKELTIAEDIEAVMDAIEGREEPAEEAVAEPSEEITEDLEADEETNEEENQEQAEETNEEEIEETDPVELAKEAAENLLTPPENWNKEDKAEFDKLDDAGKNIVKRQSESFNRGYNKLVRDSKDSLKELETIVGMMEPYEQNLKHAGLDRVAGIRSLLDSERLLSSNPDQGIRQLISHYGGPRAKEIVKGIASELGLFDAATGEADDYVDPAVLALRSELDQIKGTMQQTQTNTEQHQFNEANNQVTHFADANDDKGN